MKKKEIFGIIVIVLTVLACYASYYRFRVAIIGFSISAIIFPVVFYFVKRRFIWLSIILAVVLDLVLYWPEFNYYESRGILTYVTFAQIAVMAVMILTLKWIDAKIKK